METTLPTDTLHAETVQIIGDVFHTMLSIEIEATEAKRPSTGMVTAAVYFAGSYQGAALIECSMAQACHFTEKLMGIAAPAAVNDDVRDAMGEIANMVGGNLKALLPKGVSLSLPSVVEGNDYTLGVRNTRVLTRTAYASDTGVFWVTLVELQQKPR